MKKILATMLAAVLVFSLAACGGKKETEVPETEAQSEETTTDTDDTDGKGDELQVRPAEAFQNEFATIVSSGEELTVEEIANALITAEWVPFAGGTMVVEPGFLNGFTEEVKDFDEACQFGPMISSMPCIGYVFKLSDGVDAEEFALHLSEIADLRWNVCTEAAESAFSAKDNIVMFVMTPASFDEEAQE